MPVSDLVCSHLHYLAGVAVLITRPEYLLSHLSSKSSDLHSSSALILRSEDTSASGSPDEFLKSRLTFTKDANGQDVCLVKAGDDEVGVMMGWERDISKFSHSSSREPL